MLLRKIIFNVATVAAYTGWTIPANQPKGVYTVTINSANEPIHTFVNHLTPGGFFVNVARDLTNTPKFRLRNRWTWSTDDINCHGYQLSPPDVDNIHESIRAQCNYDTYLGGRYDLYAISRDVVGYYCNVEEDETLCAGDEVEYAEQRLDMVCGIYNAGNDTIVGNRSKYGREGLDYSKSFCSSAV